MSVYSDDDYDRAMIAIARLANPKSFKELTLEDAIERLKKILVIAEGEEDTLDEEEE